MSDFPSNKYWLNPYHMLVTVLGAKDIKMNDT